MLCFLVVKICAQDTSQCFSHFLRCRNCPREKSPWTTNPIFCRCIIRNVRETVFDLLLYFSQNSRSQSFWTENRSKHPKNDLKTPDPGSTGNCVVVRGLGFGTTERVKHKYCPVPERTAKGGNLHARAGALPPRAVCEHEEAARLAQRRVREDADRLVPGAPGPAIRQARAARRCGGVRGLAVRSFRFRPRLVGTGCCQR